MARFHLLNVTLLFLGVIYVVAYDDKKAPFIESSRLAVPAAIDPWVNVTRLLPAGATPSQLFGGCSTKARRVECKPSSVVSPSTDFIYWRYELGAYGKNSMPTTWDKVLNVADIFACADAAAAYRLFRYEGNKCSLSNMNFLPYTSFFNPVRGQPEGNKDVVFINFDLPPSSQVGNGVFISGEPGPFVNIVEFETTMPDQLSWGPRSACVYQHRSDLFTHTDALPFSTLQNYLRTNQITGEFVVRAGLNVAYPRVEWAGGLPVDLSFVDVSSYTHYDTKGVVVISSALDYKLVVKDYGYKVRGLICMSNAG